MGLDIGGVLGGIGGFMLGGPAGAAAGYGMGSSLTGDGPSATSSSSMASWAAPYMTPYFQALQNNYQNYSPKYFQGDAVANLNQGQNSLINRMIGTGNRGFQYSPLLNNSLNRSISQLQREAGGSYLNSNPYVSKIFNTASQGAMNDIMSRFAGSGRFGSGSMGNAMGTALGQVTDQVYGQNYENERNRQQQAQQMLQSNLGLMGGLQNQRWQNNWQGMQGGLAAAGMRQDQQQREIDANKARWDWQQNLPYFKLNQYGSGLGLMNAVPTNTTETANKSFAGKAGDALGILGAANDIFSWF